MDLKEWGQWFARIAHQINERAITDKTDNTKVVSMTPIFITICVEYFVSNFSKKLIPQQEDT